TELHQLRLLRVLRREPVERLREGEQLFVRHRRGNVVRVEVGPRPFAAALRGQFPPGLVHEDSPDGFSRGGENPPPPAELLVPDQVTLRLVYQRRRVERLPRLLPRELRRRQLPQLVVNERQQLRRGLPVAAVGGVEQSGDWAHCGL